jgi:methylated-DNA-[protein]-cysteine S-methyltransferase
MSKKSLTESGLLFSERILSPFGPLVMIWREGSAGPRITQVLLGRPGKSAESLAFEAFPDARPRSCREIGEVRDRMQRFLKGEAVALSLDRVALETCGEFQRSVLLAEYAIPRGRVSTYGRIAAAVGSPGGARAVGGALAGNPFPILIPCHRAVRSDGSIGGYQGGSAMKRELLKMEGVEFRDSDRVAMGRVHY